MKKLTNDEFVKRIANINSNIIILGEYVNARTKILCKCSNPDCGYVWHILPSNLIKGHNCPQCIKNQKKLTHQEFIKRVKTINPNIEIIGQYIGSATKVRCKCLIDDYEWEATPNNLLRGHGCLKCAGKLKLTHKDFVQRLMNINPNIKVVGQYISINDKVKCECLSCNYVWSAIAKNLLNGHGCPECGIKTRSQKHNKTHLQFLKEVGRVNSNIEILEEYVNAQTKIKCKCLLDGYEWEVVPNSLLKGHGCPQCNISKGEKYISDFLTLKNISYIPQYKFDNCKNTLPLPFDFYLPDYNMCIEYDGEQHFKVVDFSGHNKNRAEENFEKIKIRDNIKTKYCKKNNIKLLRIPYWEFDNIENILNEKIKNEKDETF